MKYCAFSDKPEQKGKREKSIDNIVFWTNVQHAFWASTPTSVSVDFKKDGENGDAKNLSAWN